MSSELCEIFNEDYLVKSGDVDKNNIALGDFVHDFTTFILAGDTILKPRRELYLNYITKFTYSMLATALKFDNKFIMCNSSLKTPNFRMTPKYNKHSLEHMFYKYLGINSSILNDSTKIGFINNEFIINKYHVNNSESYQSTYSSIHDFFSEFIINEINDDKVVPLVVDAQTNLFKIIKKIYIDGSQNKKYFGYCMNQEVCNDAAGKKILKSLLL